jgi:hypothetical protein
MEERKESRTEEDTFEQGFYLLLSPCHDCKSWNISLYASSPSVSLQESDLLPIAWLFIKARLRTWWCRPR